MWRSIWRCSAAITSSCAMSARTRTATPSGTPAATVSRGRRSAATRSAALNRRMRWRRSTRATRPAASVAQRSGCGTACSSVHSHASSAAGQKASHGASTRRSCSRKRLVSRVRSVSRSCAQPREVAQLHDRGGVGHHLTKRAAVGPQRIGNHARIAGIVFGVGRRKPAPKPVLLLRIDRKDGEPGVETRLDERAGPQFDAEGNRGRRHATELAHPRERVVNGGGRVRHLPRAAHPALAIDHTERMLVTRPVNAHTPASVVHRTPFVGPASRLPLVLALEAQLPTGGRLTAPGRGAGLPQVLEAHVRNGTLDRGRRHGIIAARRALWKLPARWTHIASTAPWKTLRVFHKLPRAFIAALKRYKVRGEKRRWKSGVKSAGGPA